MLHRFKYLKAATLSLLALIVLLGDPTYASMDELYGTAERRLSTIKSKLGNVGPAYQEMEYDKWEAAASPYILKEYVPKAENNLSFTDRYNLMRTVVFPVGNLNDNLKVLLYKGFEAEIAPALKARSSSEEEEKVEEEEQEEEADPQAQPKLALHKEHEPDWSPIYIRPAYNKDFYKLWKAFDKNNDQIWSVLISYNKGGPNNRLDQNSEERLLLRNGGFLNAKVGDKFSYITIKHTLRVNPHSKTILIDEKKFFDDRGQQLFVDSETKAIYDISKKLVQFDLNGGKG